MASSINKLFIGLLIVLLDLRVNELNLLPDSVGYLIVGIALGQLESFQKSFGSGRKYAALLFLVALPDVYSQGLNIFPAGTTQGINPLGPLWGGIGAALHLALAYSIFQGLLELAREKGLKELETTTAERWKSYLVIKVLVLFSMPFIMNISQIYFILLFVAISVLGFIVEILFLASVRAYFREINLREQSEKHE